MKFAVKGPDLGALFKQSQKGLAAAVTAGVNEAATGLKLELRDQVTGSGLGARLANTWQQTKKPGDPSIDVYATVYSKAPKLIDAFNRGITITAPGGHWLAIPTPYAPKDPTVRGRGIRRIASPLFFSLLFPRYGKLRMVPVKGKKEILLVADNVIAGKRAGTFRRPTKGRLSQGRQVTGIVLYILVPSVKLPKKLDADAAAQRWAATLPDAVARNWKE